MNKLPIVLVVAFLVLLYTTGCQNMSEEQKGRWRATGSFITKKVASIALQTVINGAIAAADKDRNVDFTQGLAEGLRTQQGNLLTGQDVKAIVDIWTPNKPGFNQLGAQIAQVYEQVRPQTKQEAAATLESIARGLDKATAGK